MSFDLHWTAGPVQGFVGQARTTRDLWAGSFLLSYLTTHAMVEAAGQSAQSEWILPSVKGDALYQAVQQVRGKEPVTAGPAIGTLPNRFRLRFDTKEHAIQAGKDAIATFKERWQHIADEVWSAALKKGWETGKLGKAARQIWDRQVSHFWQLNWVVAEHDAQGCLEQRKNWRLPDEGEEAGRKCSVMGTHQELSGARRAQDQQSFWEAVTAQTLETATRSAFPMQHLIREEERLCAIALIKRVYPLIDQKTIGWEIPTYWHSVSYMAALPWLCAPRSGEAGARFDEFIREVRGQAFSGSQSPLDLSSIDPSALINRPKGTALDGALLHRRDLESEKRTPLDESVSRETLLRLHREMTRDDQPSPYYTLLIMDGDKLGKALQAADKQGGVGKITDALGQFASDVRKIVHAHHGTLIYAGGDDVMALLPAADIGEAPPEGALPSLPLECAWRLREAYRAAFEDKLGESNPSTLSGALIYAHRRTPLRRVLNRAHTLLDNVAKDLNGRDSVAVEVMKPGGTYCRYVASWSAMSGDAGVALGAVKSAVSAPGGERELSASLIYRLRATLGQLCNWPEWTPGSVGHWTAKGTHGAKPTLQSILFAEYMHSLEISGASPPEDINGKSIDEHMAELLLVCARGEDGQPLSADTSDGLALRFDGLMLAHFLANGVKGEMEGDDE